MQISLRSIAPTVFTLSDTFSHSDSASLQDYTGQSQSVIVAKTNYHFVLCARCSLLFYSRQLLQMSSPVFKYSKLRCDLLAKQHGH